MDHVCSSERLDVTEIHCRDKHTMILDRWNSLKAGESFVLVNGHDPLPLYYQFCAQHKGDFDWVYEERGPKSYAIRISRQPEGVKAPPSFNPDAAASIPSCVSQVRTPSTPAGIDVDARGLMPPEPMQRIVEALETLQAGQECRALTDRRPVHLIPMLYSRGFSCASEERPDGSWINFIRHS